jgi:hypothetical protein
MTDALHRRENHEAGKGANAESLSQIAEKPPRLRLPRIETNAILAATKEAAKTGRKKIGRKR